MLEGAETPGLGDREDGADTPRAQSALSRGAEGRRLNPNSAFNEARDSHRKVRSAILPVLRNVVPACVCVSVQPH